MRKHWDLVTTEVAGEQLGISPDAARRYFHSGILAGKKQGKYVLIEQRAVLALQKVLEQARTGVKPIPPHERLKLAAQVVQADPVEGVKEVANA